VAQISRFDAGAARRTRRHVCQQYFATWTRPPEIQKYEKGANRVGGSRLQALADALDAPIAFFFEAAPGRERIPAKISPAFIEEFLADRRGIELARHFVNINDTAARDAMLVLAEVFAKRTTGMKADAE
jgi:transcriptional regulator with XRE-family HTH domain